MAITNKNREHLLTITIMTKRASVFEKRIGARITEIRKTKMLTQAQLAEKVNVSNETISRLERGITIPSIKTLKKIADTLKIPMSTFFDFEDNPPKNPVFERELAKLIALINGQSLKELTLVYNVLKVIFKMRKHKL